MSVGHFSVSGYDLRKNKYDATSAPGVNNDITEEYQPGSIWIDLTNDKAYVCLDNTDGAAVWTEISNVASVAGLTTVTAFSAHATSDQTIATGTNTKVLFGTESFDTDSSFASSTHTPKIAGNWLYQAKLTWATNFSAGTGISLLKFYKNGIVYATIYGWTGTQVQVRPNVNGAILIPMNGTTDYCEVFVYHTSLASEDLYSNAGAEREINFLGYLVS